MLTIDHLKKNYEKFSLDCSLELPEGRITGLIGQNGAGKTTAFKAILGLITPDSGEIRIFGNRCRNLLQKISRNWVWCFLIPASAAISPSTIFCRSSTVCMKPLTGNSFLL